MQKLHRKIESELAKIESTWPPGIGDLSRMPKKLRLNIVEYVSRPENRDGRGLKHAARRDIEKILGHTRSAIKVVQERKRDSNLVRTARTFLRRLPHDSCLEESLHGGKVFRGRLQRDGKNRNDRTNYFKEESYKLSDQHEVARIRSLHELQQIGRNLNICVSAHSWATRYWNTCKEGKTELWIIREVDIEVLLLEISTDSPREITEMHGLGEWDDRPNLRHEEMIALRRVLSIEVEGHDEQFVETGAFDEFLNGAMDIDSPTDTVSLRDSTFALWIGEKAVILQRLHSHFTSEDVSEDSSLEEPFEVWIRFTRVESYFWDGETVYVEWFEESARNSYPFRGMLPDLLLQYPHHMDAINKIEITTS